MRRRRQDTRYRVARVPYPVALRRRRRRHRLVLVGIVAALCVLVVVLWNGVLGGEGEGSEQASEADTEAAVVLEDEAEPEPVTQVTESGLVVTAYEDFLDSEACEYLEQQIAELEEQDVTLGIVVYDLETGMGLTYNEDEPLYSASAIKAAYCTWLMEANGGAAGMSGVVEDCLVNSSNASYTTLTSAFGQSSFSAWLEELGATQAAEEAAQNHYIDISAGELAAVWEEIWRYGTSDEDGAEELTGYLSVTNYTALGGLLRDEYEVWAKPGWYPSDSYDLTATNDAGVVFSDCGAYVIVVMTSMNADLSGLLPLIDALNAAHGEMCGGSTELLLDETTTIPGY